MSRDGDDKKKRAEVVLVSQIDSPSLPSRWAPAAPAPKVTRDGIGGWLAEREVSKRYAQDVQREIVRIRSQVEAFEAYADLCYGEMKESTRRLQIRAETVREHFKAVMATADRAQDEIAEMRREGATAAEIGGARAHVLDLVDRAIELQRRLLEDG